MASFRLVICFGVSRMSRAYRPQAPGLYLGYAAESFPGVTQAIDDDDLPLAQQQVAVAAERVAAAAHFLATGSD